MKTIVVMILSFIIIFVKDDDKWIIFILCHLFAKFLENLNEGIKFIDFNIIKKNSKPKELILYFFW